MAPLLLPDAAPGPLYLTGIPLPSLDGVQIEESTYTPASATLLEGSPGVSWARIASLPPHFFS